MIPIPEKPKPIRLVGCRAHITPLQLKRADKTAGGILVHPAYFDDGKQFMVLGVGPGCYERRRRGKWVFVKPEIAPGDRILFDTGAGYCEPLPDGTWIIDARRAMLKW